MIHEYASPLSSVLAARAPLRPEVSGLRYFNH
jgi:hypothetical protein